MPASLRNLKIKSAVTGTSQSHSHTGKTAYLQQTKQQTDKFMNICKEFFLCLHLYYLSKGLDNNYGKSRTYVLSEITFSIQLYCSNT